MPTANFILISGFLGSGKTTCLNEFALYLQKQNKKVGLITNDQGSNLADSRLLKSKGHKVEEIAGGCFCCRFSSLKEAAKKLTQDTKPDIFLAEPVGSCTDLYHGVNYPLSRIYGNHYEIGPIVVILDIRRALKILDTSAENPFSENIIYIYQKQIEESDIIIINKVDLVSEEEISKCVSILSKSYPEKKILKTSLTKSTDTSTIFEEIVTTKSSTKGTSVDYQKYGDGEKQLAWLNATYTIKSNDAFDPQEVFAEFLQGFSQSISNNNGKVAHAKLTFDPHLLTQEVLAMNVTENDSSPNIHSLIQQKITSGEFILNCRAEMNNQKLKLILDDQLKKFGDQLQISEEHLECFAPSEPTPPQQVKENILFCHCSYTKLISSENKNHELAKIMNSDTPYTLVPDLCYLCQENQTTLLAEKINQETKIVACYPRAVKWLLHQQNISIHENQVHNMLSIAKNPAKENN